jgi:hypothetical protein
MKWIGIVLTPLFLGAAVLPLLAEGPAHDAVHYRILSCVFLIEALIFAWVSREFAALRTRVTDTTVRVGWRRIGREIPRSAVRAARVVKYDWWHYGGWGWRINPFSGKTAYSAMGVPAVEIEYQTPEGRVKTVCVSSARPEELVKAIGA